MVAAREYFPRFTPEEYLAWEETQEIRYQYINGEVYAMTGGTVNHGRIGANLITMLRTHLRGSGCLVQTSDVKVSIQNSSDYVYPDMSVTCDRRDRTATSFISHPCLIVEVLSPSTEAYDRGDKFALYGRSDNLQDYVLVHSDKVALDLYSKNDRGKWEITNYRAGSLVELASIDLKFPIEEVFEDITFTTEQSQQG
jgi:Uma2 family endonuclease